MSPTARGASLVWLSQYPHEREVAFPPLAFLTPAGTRCVGAVTICELRPTLSIAAYWEVLRHHAGAVPQPSAAAVAAVPAIAAAGEGHTSVVDAFSATPSKPRVRIQHGGVKDGGVKEPSEEAREPSNTPSGSVMARTEVAAVKTTVTPTGSHATQTSPPGAVAADLSLLHRAPPSTVSAPQAQSAVASAPQAQSAVSSRHRAALVSQAIQFALDESMRLETLSAALRERSPDRTRALLEPPPPQSTLAALLAGKRTGDGSLAQRLVPPSTSVAPHRISWSGFGVRSLWPESA